MYSAETLLRRTLALQSTGLDTAAVTAALDTDVSLVPVVPVIEEGRENVASNKRDCPWNMITSFLTAVDLGVEGK